jgi:hypothetical protein
LTRHRRPSPAPPPPRRRVLPGPVGFGFAASVVAYVRIRYPWVTVQQAAVAVGAAATLLVSAACAGWRRDRRAARPAPDTRRTADPDAVEEDDNELIVARRGAGAAQRLWEHTWTAVFLAAGCAGGLWLLWRWNPWALPALGGAVTLAFLTFRGVRRRPPASLHAELNQPVKWAGLGEWCEAVGERWPEVARAARLAVDQAGERHLEPTAPPALNGVGGVVIKFDLEQAHLTPRDLQDATGVITRRLRAPYVYVCPRGGPGRIDDVHVHLYRGYPLYGHTVDYRWLQAAAPSVGEGHIPIGVGVDAEPATLVYRYSTLFTALPDSGKTHAQLAGLAGLAAAQVPTDLYLVDNRGRRGAREFEPLAENAAYYGRTAAEAFNALRLIRVEMEERNRTLRPGDQIRATAAYPLQLLVVTEHQAFVTSHPPADADVAALGLDWPAFTLGEFAARPDRPKWRALIDEWLYELARIGRGVLCAAWLAAHASLIETIGRHRDAVAQRLLFRLLEEGGVDAALGMGALAAGAAPHLIPEGPDAAGIGYLRRQTSVPLLFRAAYIPYSDLDDAVIGPHRLMRHAILAAATSTTERTRT